LTVLGTRPEAIKLAPVVRELQSQARANLKSLVCVTAQHREMLDQVLRVFEIKPDYDFNIMQSNQTPTQVFTGVLTRLEPVLREEQPDWVVVQGDTTTVAATAIAAFYNGAKVGHVEAGLRTHNKWRPFPEEINRRMAGIIADLHFAPTQRARQNLLKEGVSDNAILITGNPVIDALHWIVNQPIDISKFKDSHPGYPDLAALQCSQTKLILVTVHRRENFGKPLENICSALRDIAVRYEGRVHIVFPVHLNPNIWEPVHRLLGNEANITLLTPLDYLPLIHLM
jgi:UDP-N-acetylglucosamine 2-epimerase (non-hydrolysing)